MPDAPIRIDVVSDFVCPWCWIGKRSVDALAMTMPVRRIWHPYFLHPGLPREGMDRRALIRMKFGVEGVGRQMRAALAEAAEAAGLAIDFEAIERVPNTADAHRLVLWAAGQGAADDVAEGLFQAYFGEARDIGSCDVLIEIGGAAGLDESLLAELLAGDRDREIVEAQASDFLDRGIPGVPAHMIERRHMLVGAQSREALEQAIEAVKAETNA